MKLFRTRWVLATLLSGISLQAQSPGDAAVATAEAASTSHWQNWTFAATAAVTAASAVLVVALDPGHHAH